MSGLMERWGEPLLRLNTIPHIVESLGSRSSPMNFFDKKPGHQKPKPSGVTIIKKVIHSVTPKAQPPKPVASSSKRKLDIKPSATVKRSKPTPVSKPAPNVDPASDSSDSDDAFDPSSLFTDRGRPGTPPIADYVVPRSVVAKMEKKSWKTWDGFIHSADMMELERIGYVSCELSLVR